MTAPLTGLWDAKAPVTYEGVAHMKSRIMQFNALTAIDKPLRGIPHCATTWCTFVVERSRAFAHRWCGSVTYFLAMLGSATSGLHLPASKRTRCYRQSLVPNEVNFVCCVLFLRLWLCMLLEEHLALATYFVKNAVQGLDQDVHARNCLGQNLLWQWPEAIRHRRHTSLCALLQGPEVDLLQRRLHELIATANCETTVTVAQLKKATKCRVSPKANLEALAQAQHIFPEVAGEGPVKIGVKIFRACECSPQWNRDLQPEFSTGKQLDGNCSKKFFTGKIRRKL